MIKVLVVDDHQLIRSGIKQLLEAAGDIQVVGEADSGEQALARVGELHPDVVLMDIHMPGLDGAEAFKRLRTSASANRLTPVIALTADSMHGDREKFLSKGFDGYVSKPIDERSLVTAITQILSLPDEKTRTMLQAG